jgi:hypothetical protein
MELRSRVGLGAVAVLIASVVATADPAGAQSDSPRAGHGQPPADVRGTIDDLPPLADAAPTGRLDPRLHQRSGNRSGSVVVEVSGPAAQTAIEQVGGTVVSGATGVAIGRVEASQLVALSALPGVASVQPPVDLNAAASRSMGSGSLTVRRGYLQDEYAVSARKWFAQGNTGAGSKVGIISFFDTTVLGNQISSDILPPIPPEQRVCVSQGTLCPFGTPGYTGGNSMADILVDAAPDAKLYLAEVGTLLDFYAVIDWFAANGVTIVVNSLYTPFDGPGDGTGPAADALDYAVARGMAWFNAAGEFGTSSGGGPFAGALFRMAWSDPDRDGWLNIDGPYDETLTSYCGFTMGLRWTDWSQTTKTDLDLYVSDFRASNGTHGPRVLLSGANQALAGSKPLEANNFTNMCNQDPARGVVYDTNKDGFVSFSVKKTTRTNDTAVDDLIELAMANGFLEYNSYVGSANIPFADSKNPGMMTVGSFESYPDRYGGAGLGPTADGRHKPELVMRGCMSTSVDGLHNGDCSLGYYGTDGSAAAAAGWAALMRDILGMGTPVDLVRYMRDNAFSGRFLPIEPVLPSAGYTFFPLDTPTRVVETRGGPHPLIAVQNPGPLVTGSTVSFQAPCGGPLLATVTLVNSTQAGFVSIYPHGYSFGGATATLNVDGPGQTRSNTVIVEQGNVQRYDVFTQGGGNIVVDAIGCFSPGPGSILTTVSPHTVYDSQRCIGVSPCPTDRLAAQSFIDIPMAGHVDPTDPGNVIPTDATAVAVAVTVIDPSQNGYLTTMPGGVTINTVSNLNYVANQNATAFSIVPIHGVGNGTARVYLHRSAHLRVDLLGWFGPRLDYFEQEGSFMPLRPSRALNTRLNGGAPVSAGQYRTVDSTTVGVPSDAIAVFANNVAVQAQTSGAVHVDRTPAGAVLPAVNLSMSRPGQTVAAGALSRVDAGRYTLTTSATTHLVSDVTGYFRPVGPAHAPGQLVRITGTTDGAPPNARSWLVDISNDANSILFGSSASNLGGGGPYGSYVWNRTTDIITPLPSSASPLMLSGDGSKVLLTSTEGHDPADTNTVNDVYLYDLATASYTWVNRHPTDPATYLPFQSPDVSFDGRYVSYLSSASIDPAHLPGTTRVYRRDTTTGAVLVVAEPPGYVVQFVGMSDDGQRHMVTYRTGATAATWSIGTLTPNAPVDLPPYLVEADTHGRFVASVGYSLSLGDLSLGTERTIFSEPGTVCSSLAYRRILSDDGFVTCRGNSGIALVSTINGTSTPIGYTWNGRAANGAVESAMISSDGRYVVFLTAATNMLDEPVTAPGQIFVVDTRTAGQ